VPRASKSLHDPRGTTIISYAWDLGNLSNNLAEAYALWCGLTITKEANIRSLSVFEDSMIIVKAMIGKSTPEGAKLKTIIS
jgi:ribonuclease HI